MASELSIASNQIIMDTKLIKQYGEEKELHRQKSNLGWIELRPPVQKGWKRYYVLREDVAASKSAEIFEGILKKINTYDWSYRKDFRVRDRKKGKKIYAVKPQKLLEPNEWRFQKLGFTEGEKQYFDPEFRPIHGITDMYLCYVFREPWRFVLRTRPNLIDKIRIKDGELESKISKMREYMVRNHYRPMQIKILHGRSARRKRCPLDLAYHNWNPIRNKPITGILDKLKDEKL